jgi:hypothetical protein
MIYNKTNAIIDEAITNIDGKSNFFSTIAGSRTLAMLASFEDGRDIIKRILGMNIRISIFSYPRSRAEMTKNDPKDDDDDSEEEKEENGNGRITRESTIYTSHSNNGQAQFFSSISYRSSDIKDVSKYECKSIATSENVLTVLIDVLEYKLYKLLFNRILSDSKEIGPGCLSALAESLLFLQEEGNTGKCGRQ